MKILSSSQVKQLINYVLFYVRQYVAKKLSEALANRPESFVLTQEEYDALGDDLDPDAVYMIREDGGAAAASVNDVQDD